MELRPTLPPLTYQANGRRDPFVPISPAKDRPGLSLAAMKLAGVVQGRALVALIEAPNGMGYILKRGDVLGDDRVTDVTPSSVTFAVAAKPGQPATILTLRLAGD